MPEHSHHVKVTAHFSFAALAGAVSVAGLGLIAYWFLGAYEGNAAFLGANGGRWLFTCAVFAFFQIVFYGIALGVAVTIPRIHRVTRSMFRYWIGSALSILLLFLIFLGSTSFWSILAVFYPFLSILTAACAFITLHRSRKHIRQDPAAQG